MTTLDAYAAGSAGAPRTGPGRLAGFVNFARKDFFEWFRTRRAFWTSLAAVALILLGVLAEKVHGIVEPSATVLTDPSANMLMAGWDSMLPIFAVFTTMGILVSEREGRTLAWSLSMPLGRVSVLLSKLVTSVVGLFVFALVIPDLVAVVAVRLAYGGFPNYQSILWPAVGGGAVAVLLIVLNLAVSVFARGQRTVAAVALMAGLIVPPLVASFWPAAAPWWPISIGEWVAAYGKGDPMQSITPIVWLACLAVLSAATLWRFGREEL